MSLRVARVYICWAWVSGKFFLSCVRMSCPSWFRVFVAPYSLIVGGVWIVGFFVLGGVSPWGVMRPRYCVVIFCARCLSLFHFEVTL